MVYRGRVKNGTVVLNDNVILPDGMEVKVEPVEPIERGLEQQKAATLYERLKPFIGSATGLPRDASKRIDEFLYEHPTQ